MYLFREILLLCLNELKCYQVLRQRVKMQSHLQGVETATHVALCNTDKCAQCPCIGPYTLAFADLAEPLNEVHVRRLLEADDAGVWERALGRDGRWGDGESRGRGGR